MFDGKRKLVPGIDLRIDCLVPMHCVLAHLEFLSASSMLLGSVTANRRSYERGFSGTWNFNNTHHDMQVVLKPPQKHRTLCSSHVGSDGT